MNQSFALLIILFFLLQGYSIVSQKILNEEVFYEFRELSVPEKKSLVPELIRLLQSDDDSPASLLQRNRGYACLLELTGRFFVYDATAKPELRNAQALVWANWWQGNIDNIGWDSQYRIFRDGKPFRPTYTQEKLYSFTLEDCYPYDAVQKLSALTNIFILYAGDPYASELPINFVKKELKRILEFIAWRNGCELFWGDIPVMRPRPSALSWWKFKNPVSSISFQVKNMPVCMVLEGITTTTGVNVYLYPMLERIPVSLAIKEKHAYLAIERIAEAVNGVVFWENIPTITPRSP